VAHPLERGFTKGAVFDFVFGGDSFSFQQGRDIGDIPNVVGHASGHCRGNLERLVKPEEVTAADCNTGIYLGGETSRRRFSTTKVSAPIMRPDSIQYSAGLPLNKKAVAMMMAIAQTSDQTMADVPSLLELGIIVSTVAWLCHAISG